MNKLFFFLFSFGFSASASSATCVEAAHDQTQVCAHDPTVVAMIQDAVRVHRSKGWSSELLRPESAAEGLASFVELPASKLGSTMTEAAGAEEEAKFWTTQKTDGLTYLFSVIGSVAMGTYPVPIKTPSVVKAQPHPIVFQCYKSFWACVAGWAFVLNRLIHGQELVFAFSWLAVVSAAAWVPAGLCLISAVPRVGVGMAMTVNTGTLTVLSCLIAWLCFGEKMKRHGVQGYYLAPVYLACIVAGIAALVVIPQGFRSTSVENGKAGSAAPHFSNPGSGDSDENGTGDAPDELGKSSGAESGPALEAALVSARFAEEAARKKLQSYAIGVLLVFACGTLATVQFGIVNVGKSYAQTAAGCKGNPKTCPAELTERFNTFGSWMATFGSSALIISVFMLMGLWTSERIREEPPTSFHWFATFIPGNIAGLLWSIGNIFQLAAVVRGGNAVVMPMNAVITLIVSGLWGLIYYKEVDSMRRAVIWSIAAGWTVAMIVLLSGEKVTSP